MDGLPFNQNSIAVEAIQWYDKEAELSGSGCPFNYLVQMTTPVVVLAGLLDVDNPIVSFRHADITLVANNITILWALSKKHEPVLSRRPNFSFTFVGTG